MVQSVELLLEADGDRAIRADWDLLEGLGLRTPARHRTDATRPHITLAAADHLPDEAERAIDELRPGLPISLVIDGLLIFGGRRLVLTRPIAPSRALLDLHRAIVDAVASAGWPPDTLRPGRWNPHVTLARDVDGPRLALACHALPDRRIDTAAIGLRRWDGRRRSERLIAGRSA